MSVKEKLVELLDEIQHQGNSTAVGVNYVFNNAIADHLIANGVTIRPKGEWIEQEAPNMDTYYDCSAGGESFCFIEGSPKDNLYCYCPNCGADMRGET